MTQVAFDSLDYSKQLIDAGMSAKIAEIQAKMQVEILKNMLTKYDLDAHRFATTQDLLVLEQRLLEKFMLHANTATSDRQVIRGEARLSADAAAKDRQAIRDEMKAGFDTAAKDRQAIRDEMRAGFHEAALDRAAIRAELKSLENRLTIRMGLMFAANITLLSALMTFLLRAH